mgnify:CR=1 FL=1
MKVTSEQLRQMIDFLPDWEETLRNGREPFIRFPIIEPARFASMIYDKSNDTVKFTEVVFEIDISRQGWVLKDFEV